MKIAITGAGGFIGRQLVPEFQSRGIDLLLVGRDPDALRALFPGSRVASYQELGVAGVGCDSLIHLEVLNNEGNRSPEEFKSVNVDLALETCLKARAAGIWGFTYVSSTHALDERDQSYYAESKRLAARELNAVEGIQVVILYLPAMIAHRFSGKLAVLNVLPRPLQAILLPLIQSLKATVKIDDVVEAVLAGAERNSNDAKEIVLTCDQTRNPFYRFAIRLFDLAFVAGILIFLWWAMILVWILIRIQSPGPGIFRQERVGRSETVFSCYKFRTMYVSAPNAGTHEVPDSMVTPIGRFLRRTKLDELPQIINIIKNEMSVVGPRPSLPSQTLLISERRKRDVFSIKPGVTGLAQINGVNMSTPASLADWDYRYLKLRGLLLDVHIVLATALGKGAGDNTKTKL